MRDGFVRAHTARPQLSEITNAAFLSLTCALLLPNSMLVAAGDPDDSSVFAYIGWLMKRGYVPYRDVWDHKGPLLYYLNWFGWVLTPGSTAGIGVLQVVLYAAAFFVLLRILQLAAIPREPVLCTALFSVAALAQFSQGGNMAETWSIGAIALSHFVVFAATRARAVAWHFAVLGVCFAACFFLRPNLCLVPALAILAAGHVQRLRRGFAAGGLGLAVSLALAVLVSALLLWPLVHWGAMAEFRDAYFVYNGAYSRFTTWQAHAVGALELLLVPRSMAFAFLAIGGWAFLFRRGLRFPPVYRFFLLACFPLEFLAAALSGRAYFHYLASLWPTMFVLSGVAAAELRDRLWFGRRRIVALALLVIATGWEIRRYLLFENKATRLDGPEMAVAAFIDSKTSQADRILPVGDTPAAAVALRSRREPAGRFIYQLAMVHRANPRGREQEKEELASIDRDQPKIIFSLPGPAGNLCGSAEPLRLESENQGYRFDEMADLLRPVLERNYRRVADPRFADACVYERR